jgi:hypothetical protein
MSNKDQPFAFDIDDKPEARAALEALFVIRASKKGAAPLALRLHDAFVKRFRDRLRFMQLSSSKTARKIKPKDFEALATMLKGKEPQGVFGLALHSGATATYPEAPRFEDLHDELGTDEPIAAVRICLPDKPLADALAEARGFVDLVKGSELLWGSVGYSFNWVSGGYNEREVRAWMAPKLKRHPAFSTGDLAVYMTWSKFGVPHVGWMTILGKAPVETLGGYKALAEQAAKAKVGCAPLPEGGAVLQAGPEPSIGDVNRGDRLPLQRAVGKLIEPVALPADKVEQIVYVPGFPDDDSAAWAARFFRD